MAANNNVEEIKIDASELQSDEDDFDIQALPVNYGLVRGQLDGTPEQNCTDTVGNNSLEQCGTTFSGLELPCVSTQSSEHTGHVVKTFRMEKYKDNVLDIDNIPKDVHLRKGQWPYSYMIKSPENKGFLGYPIPKDLHLRKGHRPYSYQMKIPENKGFLGDPISRVNDKPMASVGEDSKRGDMNAWNIMQPFDYKTG